jgi:hypothetical protein
VLAAVMVLVTKMYAMVEMAVQAAEVAEQQQALV